MGCDNARRQSLKLAPSNLLVRYSVHPFSAFGSENGQFVVHELRLADCARHPGAGRVVPVFAHLFAGMTTPAFDECPAGEGTAIDLL